MEISEIKARLSIESVLRRYGHAPEKSGRMQCPFHEDRNPSFQVFEGAGRWKCFATGCDADHGDVIDLIERLEGISTGEAIHQAKAWAKGQPLQTRKNGSVNGSESGQSGGAGPKRVDTEKEAEQEARKLAQREVLGEVLTYFRKALNRSKPARTYLTDRKLDPSVLDVGYNSGRFHRDRPTEFIEQCVQAGLLKEKGRGHRAFASGCVIFPLLDRDGRPVSFYGRSIGEGKGDHYFLPGRSGLYPGYPPKQAKRLILTEAILDAASLQTIRSKEKAALPEGTRVLSLYGTNGWTGEHTEAVQSLGELEEAVLFFDGDEAGEAAAEEVAGTLKETRPRLTVSRVETPAGEDVNSLHAREGPETVASLIEDRTEIDVSATAVSEETDSAEGEEEGSSSSEEPSSENPPSEPGETPQREATRREGRLDTSNPDWLIYRTGDLKITVQGGIELEDLGRMRVTLKIDRTGPEEGSQSGTAFRDRLDLYRAARTEKTAERAAEALGKGTPRLKDALSRLTSALEEYRLKQLEALEGPDEEEPQLTEAERERAEAYLEKPGLLKRTNEDIGRAGVVGERKNRLLMYLAFTSRLRERPLHVLCLAPSGAGKTHLQETVGSLIPEEEKKEITALSENALYYFEEEELKHQLLLIEDLDGAEETLYPIRELQSKGRLVKSVPIKDPRSEEIHTEELVVEGPVSTAATTTRERLTGDNESRALILHLDDSKEQSERVQRYQRKRSAGKVDEASAERARKRLQDVQRRLKPVEVRNPYAEALELPPEVFKQRRANQLYLDVIETITFYHQRQREVKRGRNGRPYVETQIEDIEAANELLAPVLSVKSDELTEASRRFLEKVRTWLKENRKETFYAKEVRRALRRSPSSVKRYLRQLREYGFVEVVGGGRYSTGYEYELTRYGQEGKPDAKRYLDETLSEIKEGTPKADASQGDLSKAGTSEQKTGRDESEEKADST